MESIDQVWVFGAIVLVAGAMLGALLHKMLTTSSGDVARLKADLEQARSEMERYKTSVNRHFNKTSDLVSELTQDYIKVYQHLAEGAQTLSDERKFTQMLEQSQGKVLISVEEDISAPEAVVVDAVSESPEPAAPKAEAFESANAYDVETEDTSGEAADQARADSERRDPQIGDDSAADDLPPSNAPETGEAATAEDKSDAQRAKKPAPAEA